MRRFRSRLLWNFLAIILVFTIWGAVMSVLTRDARHPTLIRIITLVLLLGASGAARRFSRMMARPVEMLTEATRRFGAGELSYRIVIPPKLLRARERWRARRGHRRHHHHGHRLPLDEMIELGQAWNDMAERIERLVRGQKELLANVSHDLRSPLARIRVAVELLPRGDEAKLRGIEEDLGELDHMIDDILTAARLDGATSPARFERVSVPELLAQLGERARTDPQFVNKEIVVEPGTAVEIDADGALVRRAIWNLLENAARHGAPPITLAATQAGDRVRITVTDHGAGIPAAERTKVFEPFHRLDKARTPGTGVGLGLTIAHRVAEAHGGTVIASAAQEDGTGARFTIDLPLLQSLNVSHTPA